MTIHDFCLPGWSMTRLGIWQHLYIEPLGNINDMVVHMIIWTLFNGIIAVVAGLLAFPLHCATGDLNVDSLWPGDATSRHRSGSTLAQVMACCLLAPSHYLNQCWLVISRVRRPSFEDIITRRSEDTNQSIKIEICILKLHPDLPGANELMWIV